jgi:hypothetical protein
MNEGCSSQEWTTKYLFIEVSGKAVCRESIAILKDYNLSWHFQTKHAEKYRNMSSEQRASKELLSQLHKDFWQLHSENDGIARASYVLSHKSDKDGKHFAEGKLMK